VNGILVHLLPEIDVLCLQDAANASEVLAFDPFTILREETAGRTKSRVTILGKYGEVQEFPLELAIWTDGGRCAGG